MADKNDTTTTAADQASTADTSTAPTTTSAAETKAAPAAPAAPAKPTSKSADQAPSAHATSDDALFKLSQESAKRAAAEAAAAAAKAEADNLRARLAELENSTKSNTEVPVSTSAEKEKPAETDKTEAPKAESEAAKPSLVTMTPEELAAMKADVVKQAREEATEAARKAMEAEKLEAARDALLAKYALPKWVSLEGSTVADLEKSAQARKADLSPAVAQQLRQMGVPSPATSSVQGEKSLPNLGLRSTPEDAKAFYAAKQQLLADAQRRVS